MNIKGITYSLKEINNNFYKNQSTKKHDVDEKLEYYKNHKDEFKEVLRKNHEELMEEVDKWCGEILDKSPTAIKVLKYSFNSDSDNIFGISRMGLSSLELFHTTDEAHEGIDAFLEKRPPEFSKFRKN